MWTGLLLMCLKSNPDQCMPFVSTSFFDKEEDCYASAPSAVEELAVAFPDWALSDDPICVQWSSETPNV